MTRNGQRLLLLIDDEPAQRLIVRALLERRGFGVVEAADGVEALERMRAQDGVGLVVADLQMPRMDGLELIWALRSEPRWQRLPVIVVTGEVDELLEMQLLDEGADDYVRKPFSLTELMARARRRLFVAAPDRPRG